MEQHPVPQQISSYEFRLVGDMTLKQFGQVAGGCLIALIFYASPLPGYFKWPLVLLSALAGTAMAFLPFEERPLQTWVIAFLKAVYSPTQFIWQKQAKKPEIFEEKAMVMPKIIPSPAPSGDQKKLAGYLAGLTPPKNPLDQKEENFLSEIQNLFSVVPAPLPTQPTQPPLPRKEPVEEKLQEAIAQEEVKPPQYVPPAYASPLPRFGPRWRGTKAATARFDPEIPIPTTPDIPNVLVGMVRDREGKIVEGAILEIRDSQGNPARALRTNRLGQFRIATPLTNDAYEIETEKEGLEFDIVKVTLKGEIVQPIEIKAK